MVPGIKLYCIHCSANTGWQHRNTITVLLLYHILEYNKVFPRYILLKYNIYIYDIIYLVFFYKHNRTLLICNTQSASITLIMIY